MSTDRGVLRLLEAVDFMVQAGMLNARSRVADAALDLADEIGYRMGTAEVDAVIRPCPTCCGHDVVVEERASQSSMVAHDANPDPPPIICERVYDTDGRPTWEATGRQVRLLQNGWEWALVGYGHIPRAWKEGIGPYTHNTYLVRRVQR